MSISFAEIELYISFLRHAGANKARGLSGGTLLEHLVGTSHILQRWECSDVVVITGLFHDVYSSELLGAATHVDRPSVVELLGAPAERYVWLFSELDYSALLQPTIEGERLVIARRNGGTPVQIAPEDLRSLVTVFWASCLEEILSGRFGQSHHIEQLLSDALASTSKLLPPRASCELLEIRANSRASNSNPVAGLSTLLGDGAEEAFVAEYWPSRPYLSHGPVERLRSFLPSDIRDLLKLPCYGISAFAPLSEGTEGLHVDFAQAMPLYRSGFTLYFHDIQSAAFEPWIAAIGDRLGLYGDRTRVSAFASSRGGGVAAHYDANDNFVVQIKGTKRWRLATQDNVVNPTVGYRVDRPPNAIQAMQASGHQLRALPREHAVLDLRPGSVAYIPRGHWHQCETLDNESLHFNIQTGLLTKGDLIIYILLNRIFPVNPSLRARICHGFSSGTLTENVQEELRVELRRLSEGIENIDMAVQEDIFRHFSRQQHGVLLARNTGPNIPVVEGKAHK
jgi:50S ribosomal protein L16 3-hydroxylase